MRRVLGLATVLAAILGGGGPGAAAPAPSLNLIDHWAAPDGRWDFSAFDPVHRRLYVARRNGVTAVDADTGKVTPQLLAADHVHAAIPVNDGAEVLVTVGAAAQAVIADAHSGVVRATIPVGKKPDDALVEPSTGLAMVFDNAGGGVTLVDPRAGKAVGTIATPGALESAAAEGGGRVFANVEDLNEITVFDVKARQVVAHWKLEGCESPSGLAYDPQAKLLVSACANKVAKVVSPASGKIVASLPIGGRPDWAGYDAKSRTVLIPTGEDGMIDVIALEPKPTVVASVPGRAGSRSGAIDPKTGRLYLPSADFAAEPGGKPAPVPGSFKILVLGEAR
jgi:DNA-binding beta-propeller fold protein YncE